MADDSTSQQEMTNVQPFSSMPGPKGLPVLGTLLDYFKKDGPKFNKMFDVRLFTFKPRLSRSAVSSSKRRYGSNASWLPIAPFLPMVQCSIDNSGLG